MRSWKPGPNESILHPKHTHNFWGAVVIVSCQYSWKMYQSNFSDFFVSGHHRNRPRARKVKNRAQMTRFCIRNITKMFGVQFLSFFVSTAEKCFSQILVTFPNLDTTRTGLEQAKLQTGPGWLCFAPELYQQCLECSSYPFLSLRRKNISVEFWWLFQA